MSQVALTLRCRANQTVPISALPLSAPLPLETIMDDLIRRLRSQEAVDGKPHEIEQLTDEAADALEAANARIAELEQELRNIANADTVEWDDPTQFEAWAKSRARHTLGKTT
jgi:ABC-type transporter Mla subunit MlaD